MVTTRIDKLSNVKNCCRVYKFNICDDSMCIIPHNSIDVDEFICTHTKEKEKKYSLFTYKRSYNETS